MMVICPTASSAEDTKAVRVQLAGELTPNLSVRVSMDYAALRGNLTGGSYVGGFVYNPASQNYSIVPSPYSLEVGAYDPRAQAFIQQFLVQPSARPLGPLPGQPDTVGDFYGANAEINWRTDLGTLTVIPAWRYDKIIATTGSYGFVTYNNVKDEQYSIEARFQGNRIGMFDYTVGGLYFHESQPSTVCRCAPERRYISAVPAQKRVDRRFRAVDGPCVGSAPAGRRRPLHRG